MTEPKNKNNVGQHQVSIQRYSRHTAENKIASQTIDDVVAVESPLEIRVVFSDGQARKDRSLSITMRTPGNDNALATGFLLSEGIIENIKQISSFEACGPIAEGETVSNQLRVNLAEGFRVDMSRLQRHFYTTSSCGVCGKASLDAVQAQNVHPITDDEVTLDPKTILGMPDQLRDEQSIFATTGGLHAAGLLAPTGRLQKIAEDVGRHNAVDKLIGRFLIDQQQAQLKLGVLTVSGRASFELVQKAAVAGIPVMIAVGAPSSLAIELAERFGITLIGFNSGRKFNVYAHQQRIVDR
jgi:FdhD protein